jgi:hypothetical protein
LPIVVVGDIAHRVAAAGAAAAVEGALARFPSSERVRQPAEALLHYLAKREHHHHHQETAS